MPTYSSGLYGRGLYGRGLYSDTGVNLTVTYNVFARVTATLTATYNIGTIVPPPVSGVAPIEDVVLPTDLDSFAERIYNLMAPVLSGTR